MLPTGTASRCEKHCFPLAKAWRLWECSICQDELSRPRAGRAARPHPAGCFVSDLDSLTVAVSVTMDGAANRVNGYASSDPNVVRSRFKPFLVNDR